MAKYICFPKGKAKALTMSYDDGVQEDIRLIDIFNKNGIKGTFNLNYGISSGEVTNSGARPRIPLDKIKGLYAGHEIATHSYSHPTLARCSATDIAAEILKDREGWEALTGQIVRGHAYPNCSYNEEIKNIFSSLGIAYGRVVPTTGGFELPTDPMEWHATCHHSDPRLMDLAREFADFKKSQYLKLMYVWGHAYEFEESESYGWEVIEEFCEFMGGRDDIWYATNIEIIDYLNAAKQIRFSADSSFAYNPTTTSVWVQVDGEKYVELEPRKTTNCSI